MPSPGTFVVHDSVRPPLPAGDYTLTVQQALEVTSGSATIPPLSPASWDFRVVGPRFTLPSDQQLSVFPPADSSGAYADRLPQIVLQRRTLPYERRIVLTDDPATTPPWLALVVLAEGEGQLVANQPVDTSGFPDPEDQDASVRDVLRVSQTVVQTVFPSLTDLPWLTHVREVDMSDTELALGSDGWMSVVVANRLPVPGPPATPGGAATPRRYGAFLISLEGHVSDLPTVETPASTFGRSRSTTMRPSCPAYQAAVAAQALPLESLAAAQTLIATAQPATPGTGTSGTATSGTMFQCGQCRVHRPGGGRNPTESSCRRLVFPPWQRGAFRRRVDVAQPRRVHRRRRDRGVRAGSRVPGTIVPILTFTVLTHWSFTSLAEGDFRYLMQHVDLGMLGDFAAAPPPPARVPRRRAHPRPPLTVLDTGHLPSQGVSRAGAQTTSWYRGPFTPRAVLRPAAADPNGVLAWASDQLRRVGPDGREEISLAVAYELGRHDGSGTAGFDSRSPGLAGRRLLRKPRRGLVGRRGVSRCTSNWPPSSAQEPRLQRWVTGDLLSTIGAPALGPVDRPAHRQRSCSEGQSLSQTIAQAWLGHGHGSALLGDPLLRRRWAARPLRRLRPPPQQLAALTEASSSPPMPALSAAATGIAAAGGGHPYRAPATSAVEADRALGAELATAVSAPGTAEAAPWKWPQWKWLQPKSIPPLLSPRSHRPFDWRTNSDNEASSTVPRLLVRPGRGIDQSSTS